MELAHKVSEDAENRRRQAALAEASGSEIPAIELRNMCSIWREHASKCDGDMRLALESCAMDLDRLREAYSPNAPGERPGATTKKETNAN